MASEHVYLSEEQCLTKLADPRQLMNYKTVLSLKWEWHLPGVYAWFFYRMPGQTPRDHCNEVTTGWWPLRSTWSMLYVGRSGSEGLAGRVLNCHFDGELAHGITMSTFRMSLAVLLSYRLVHLGEKAYDLSEKDNQNLSEWMRANARVMMLPCDNYEEVEHSLIKHFNPPLNIKQCQNPFKRTLARLRAEGRQHAMQKIST